MHIRQLQHALAHLIACVSGMCPSYCARQHVSDSTGCCRDHADRASTGVLANRSLTACALALSIRLRLAWMLLCMCRLGLAEEQRAVVAALLDILPLRVMSLRSGSAAGLGAGHSQVRLLFGLDH